MIRRISLAALAIAMLVFALLGLIPTALATAAPAQASGMMANSAKAVMSPAAPSAPAGSCSSTPVNPQDEVAVTLTSGSYVIEEYDNGLVPPRHRFNPYNVATQGSLTVWASPQLGMRAWACPSYNDALEESRRAAASYHVRNPGHATYWNGGYPVRTNTVAAPTTGCTIVNPVDGELVVLTPGTYLVEVYDNRSTPPVHRWQVWTIASINGENPANVLAIPLIGERAYLCDPGSAYSEAARVGASQQAAHPDWIVSWTRRLFVPVVLN